MKSFAPAVKWSGSKRSQAAEIIRRFPSHINTYWEPFCGGCSVLRRLLDRPPLLTSVKRFVCSDLNGDLIGLWKEIKNDPERLVIDYDSMWACLNQDDDRERKKRYFDEFRAQFNADRDPSKFLFIMRTTTNGMPRYNRERNFNNSFHITRNGIEPVSLRKILNEWSCVLRANDVEFRNCSYDQISPQAGDLVYMDPPYAASSGMYFCTFDVDRFFKWVGTIPSDVKWLVSFDGKAGDDDYTYDVPNIYKTHEYLKSGNSSFRRTIGMKRSCEVMESLYRNF